MQLLELLRSQFAETQEQIRALTDEIAEAGGTASDTQAGNLATLNETLEGLVPRIEQASAMHNRMHSAAGLLNVPNDLDARLEGARRRQPSTQWSSFGEYARALADGAVDDGTRDDLHRITLERERATSRGVHQRAAFDDVTTTQVPGLLPPTWLTDIIDFIGVARPFISAFDVRPLPPTGMTVNYPTVTVRPEVGIQATEKTDIVSRATNVTSGVASIATYGGGEDVSVQVLQRTEPAYLGLMLELYAEEMAAGMDAAAIASARTAITQDLTIDAATPEDWSTQFAAAAGLIAAAHGQLDACVMSVGAWVQMAGAVDGDGRPLFPHLSPVNPVGFTDLSNPNSGNIRGINFVVDPWMTANHIIVGWSHAFVSLLSGMQTMRADNPLKLGVDYAVFEMAAFAPRKPTAMVDITVTPVA